MKAKEVTAPKTLVELRIISSFKRHLQFDLHSLNGNLGNFSIACSNNDISVRKKSKSSNTLAEKSLNGTNSLENSSFDVNFKEISSGCSTVSERVSSIQFAASKFSLGASQINIQGFDLQRIRTYMLIYTFLAALSMWIV